MTDFTDVKKDDTVLRMLAGTIPMKLSVTDVTEDRIICGGGWEFDRQTGYEIDDDIPVLVSYLVKEH
jgi:hypothetical protein